MQELDAILHAIPHWGGPLALATVVATEGHSYRKAGARMLVAADGRTLGTVSGGCVEREVAQRARPVFGGGGSLLMSYDGRLRLGCAGTLHILIEAVADGAPGRLLEYRRAYRARADYAVRTYWNDAGEGGTVIEIAGMDYRVGVDLPDGLTQSASVLTQTITPARQLLVFGAEADGLTLAHMASLAGWQTTLITHPRNPIEHEATHSAPYRAVVLAPEEVGGSLNVDERTALVLMSHSFPRDYAYFHALSRGKPLRYLGVLGPRDRRDKLIDELLERSGDVPEWLEDGLRGPIGLRAGGRSPGEIAVSTLAELQAIFPDRISGAHSTDSAGETATRR